MAASAFLVRHVLELAVFALAIYGYGRLATRRLPFRDGLEVAAFAGALGAGILGTLLQLLGLAGGLSPPAILALILAPAALVLMRWRPLRCPAISFERSERAAFVLLAAALLAGLGLALYPPTGFDATLYHLPMAMAFSRQHAVTFLPDLRFPVFPHLYEMLFSASLSLSDDVTAQWTHFWSLALTTAGLVCAGRRLGAPRSGIWAAAAWVGSPLVLHVGSNAYVDAGLAMFGTFCLLAWLDWRESGDPRWLACSAAFAGFAGGTKYLGLFLAVVLPAATALSRRFPDSLRQALRFAGVALLVLTPFYAPILLRTGNPVFPYFSRWFGASPWSQPLDPVAASAVGVGADRAQLPARIARFRHPLAIARVPWRLVTRDKRFGETPPVSPVLLAAIPLLLWGSLVRERVRPLSILVLIYSLAWYVFCPDRRFLLIVLPVAFLCAASTLDGALRRVAAQRRMPPGIAAAGAAALLLAPGLIWSTRTLLLRGRLPVTEPERDAYLARSLPFYPALAALNAMGSGYTVYGLFCENAAYFARGRFLGDHFGLHPFARVAAALDGSRHLYETLQRMGATHLLVNESKLHVPLPLDADFAILFHALPSGPGARLFALAPDGAAPPVSSPPRS